jgi:RNA polymerase sigma factor (TIGR02999 family)
MGEPGDITRLLREWRDGQPDAFQSLLPLVYGDLHRIAGGYLNRERPGHTLQATALVHELYLKLCDQREANWKDRAHFFTFTAKLMRMILTDHARRRLSDKRGSGAEHLPLSDEFPWVDVNGPQFIDFDFALEELERIDRRKAQMVELCHVLGYTTPESAEIMDISLATAERDLKFARGWLYRRLRPAAGSSHVPVPSH